MGKEIISTNKGPSAIGPYSQAVKANGFVYVSGQIAIVPETGQIVEGGIEAQTHRAMENLKGILEAAGSSLDNAVKTTVFIKNMDDFATVNKIYGEYFSGNYPARACVEVSRLPKDVLVEVEVIATA